MTYVVSLLRMLMTRAVLGTLLGLIATVALFAQHPLAGTWTGETRSGTAIVLMLAVKDTTLTGTLKRGDDTVSISDGKVSKNTFTFKAVLGGEPEALSGEVNGDEVKAWLDRQGPSTAITFRREKTSGKD